MKLLVVLFFSFVYLNGTLINGSGSTLSEFAYYSFAYNYSKKSDVSVQYDPIGSYNGRNQIKNRNVDFVSSDTPLSKNTLKKQNLIQFPVFFGSIVVVHNIKGVPDKSLKLSKSVLSGIFTKDIIYWDDKKIIDLNPELKLPHEEIHLIYRSDNSGSTYNFTSYLTKISNKWAVKHGTNKYIRDFRGIGAKGSSALVSLVKNTPNSISYVDNVYKNSFNLSSVTIQTLNNQWISPTSEIFLKAIKKYTWKNKFTIMDEESIYPLIVPSYAIVPREYLKNNNNVYKFYMWILKSGDDALRKLGYQPIANKSMVFKYLDSK